jgi:hypothetical protein
VRDKNKNLCERKNKIQHSWQQLRLITGGGALARDFVVTNSNSIALGHKKKTDSKGFVIGPNAIKFVTLTIVAILAVVYLSQSTAGASRSIRIRDLEQKKGDLLLEKERLEAEQTRLKALKEIDNGIEKQPMEPVSSVNHPSDQKNLAKLN